jgi:hypothetical protein
MGKEDLLLLCCSFSFSLSHGPALTHTQWLPRQLQTLPTNLEGERNVVRRRCVCEGQRCGGGGRLQAQTVSFPSASAFSTARIDCWLLMLMLFLTGKRIDRVMIVLFVSETG